MHCSIGCIGSMASTINALWRSATAADDAGQFCSANCAALAATKHIPAHVWQQLMQEGISKVMAAVLGRGLSLLLECDTGVNSRTAQQCTYDALLGATKQIITPMFEVQTHLSSQGLSKRDFNAGMQSCAGACNVVGGLVTCQSWWASLLAWMPSNGPCQATRGGGRQSRCSSNSTACDGCVPKGWLLFLFTATSLTLLCCVVACVLCVHTQGGRHCDMAYHYVCCLQQV
jgi:hypothetical protein